MTRTTILLENDLLLRVKQLAQVQGTTFTAIFREALNSYLEANQEPRSLSFIAIGQRRKGNLSEDVEKILRQKARRQRS